MSEGTKACDRVIEGNIDLDGLRDQLFDVFELGELVLGFDIVRVNGDHARHETAEWGDAVAFLTRGQS